MDPILKEKNKSKDTTHHCSPSPQ